MGRIEEPFYEVERPAISAEQLSSLKLLVSV
jgi:hypothetical protein